MNLPSDNERWVAASGAASLIPRFTPADRGIVEMPMLAPHLEFRQLDEHVGMLVSETYNTALYGKRYVDLMPLLDGTRSRREIAVALADNHSQVEIQTTLVSLASNGRVVSGDFAMDRTLAAFWSAHGSSPRWAEQRLSEARVQIVGTGGERLAAHLDAFGIALAADKPTLTVVLTNDYLDENLAGINRHHLGTGVPWVPVQADGMFPLFGPVFRAPSACWACLAHRFRSNREVENFVRNVAGEAAAIRPRAAALPLFCAVGGLAANEIAKWIVLEDSALLHEHAVSLEAFSLAIWRHKVMRRPQCDVCGSEALYRPDRPPAPVELQPSPKPVRNSGGVRSVAPEETVREHRHLVSPISGVVTGLTRITDEMDPWLHVYWAGSNLALKSANLGMLRNSLRTKSSGKGATAAQSEASALCEAIERYSGVFHGDEIQQRRPMTGFPDDEAVHPNEIMLFSDRQYADADTINARGARFNRVPRRFDPTVEMDWTPVWSMTESRHRYLPTSMLYFSKPPEREGISWCGPDSNGCAAGNTLEEAILQGFLELVERDAFACWWYNRTVFPEMDLDSFGNAYLSETRHYYGSINRDVWLIDVTNDLGIPVIVAVSRRTDKDAEDILYSAGAHLDPEIAALRAVCELNQYLAGIKDAKADGTGYNYDDPECLWWWHNIKLADQPWLAPASGVPPRGMSDYRAPDTTDVREDVEYCRTLVEREGMEFLVLDQTRPDIRMPVARTIVPGMRHFWARFAPGRLYDVPVKTGSLDGPTAEADLNPIPVFI